MREIKFRAWTGKEYRYSPQIGEWDCEDCELFSAYVQGTIIEQFTGLIDKNGKEIYEGDIVKVQIGDIPFGNSEIYWDDELCEFGYRMLDEPFHARLYMDREIVGNIHENPELMTT
jgi:hypothetical protein